MKVYDCFPFWNELDLLEIRLNELDSVVDYFVLCECFRTHRNRPKPFVFEENKARFAKWLPKIRHVKITEWPDPTFDAADANPWLRENHQRRRCIEGLYDAEPDDLIILGDADEICRACAVALVKRHMADTVVIYDQDLHYYWLNLRAIGGWHGSRSFPFGLLRQEKCDLEVFRKYGGDVMYGGGWHFSYLGGVEAIREKVQNFAHAELDQPQHYDDTHILDCIANGKDLYGRSIYMFAWTEIGYPEYPAGLVQNMARYKHLIAANARTEWLARTYETIRALECP